MKRRWLIILYTLALLLPILPQAQAEEGESVKPVLVGLYYDSNTLDGANLKNSVGTGYRLGYLDENRAFWQMGYIAETDISVVKTQNVWCTKDESGRAAYTAEAQSDVLVGCWHVRLPTEVPLTTFEEAAALAQVQGGFPAWITGEWQVRLGAYGSQEEAQTAAEALGGTVVGTSSYGVSVVRTWTSTILFQFDGGAETSLTINPGEDDSQKNTTHFKGRKYYGMFRYQRINGGDLTVVNILDLDDYANCVITQEMSPSWPLEALKAQAVCARTYWESHVGKHSRYGFDLCATVDCQAYPGMGAVTERTTQAAQETAKLRIWHEGKPIEAVYFSSDGGATEDAKNVWGGVRPYLIGKEDPYEAAVADKISKYHWTVTFTQEELNEKLHEAGYAVGVNIVDFKITETTPMGNVCGISFIGENGKAWPFTREKCRTFLGLRSLRYTVTRSGGGETGDGEIYTDGGNVLTSMNGVYAIDGSGTVSAVSGAPYVITGSGTQKLPGATDSGDVVYTINGSGWGHNVGMSQWGAHAMALQGYTYDQILKFYYTDVEIY